MKTTVLLVATLLLALATIVDAKPVFGPSEFVRRQGTPEERAVTFANRIAASGYTLLVVNGMPDGSKRVSSAWVWLNGVQILGPGDFNQRVAEIRRPVALQALNEVRVRVAGAPGGILTVTIAATVNGAGGFVATPAGARLTIPAAATDGEIDVDIRDVPLDDIPALPPGYGLLGAVAVDLERELRAEAELAIPGAVTSPDRLIVARVVASGDSNRLSIVDTASVGPGGVIHTDSPPFPGVRSGGTYVFAQLPPGIGLGGVTVQGEDGVPVNGAVVDFLAGSAGPTVPPELFATGAQALAVFVGQSDANGFAAVPVAPDTELFAVATVPGAVLSAESEPAAGLAAPSAGFAGVQSFNTPGTVPLPPTLANLVTIVIQRLTTNQTPPPIVAPCPCTTLLISPPAPIPALAAGQSLQLDAFCGPDRVTASTSFNTIADLIRLLSLGVSIRATVFQSSNPTVATVSTSGLVTANGQGQTTVTVVSTTLSWPRFDRPPRLCVASGAVRIDVAAPARLTVQRIGPRAADGVVTSTPPPIACGTRCAADFQRGDHVTLAAAPLPNTDAAFVGWGGDCAACGASPACPIEMAGDKSCTAAFDCLFAPPNGATLFSSRDLGAASMAVPTCANTIRIVVTVPRNMISGSGTTGDCGRGDVRVSVRVCPPNAGCTGFDIQAGQGHGLDICHDLDQVLGPYTIINPRIPGTTLTLQAVTEKTSIAVVESRQ